MFGNVFFYKRYLQVFVDVPGLKHSDSKQGYTTSLEHV